MVSPVLQETVVALSRDERIELRDFIDLTLGVADTPPLTDEQKATVRRRAAEMAADPAVGVPWEEVYDDLMAELQ
jgi:putative addiction module component (TIGR02574 family)